MAGEVWGCKQVSGHRLTRSYKHVLLKGHSWTGSFQCQGDATRYLLFSIFFSLSGTRRLIAYALAWSQSMVYKALALPPSEKKARMKLGKQLLCTSRVASGDPVANPTRVFDYLRRASINDHQCSNVIVPHSHPRKALQRAKEVQHLEADWGCQRNERWVATLK